MEEKQLFFLLVFLAITFVVVVYINYKMDKTKESMQAHTILTLSTTFKNDPSKFHIYSSTLRNWAMLKPRVQLILYTHETDENLIKLAASLGWLIVDCPRVTEFKVPYFKEMLYELPKHAYSVFYGFSNGDILFDEGLVDTLTTVEKYLNYLEDVLVIGQRYNVNFMGEELYKPEDVRTTAHEKGELFTPFAIDYFLIAHNRFVWDKLADVIIARPAYDNYVVTTAINNDVPVVDATDTLLAVHLTGSDGIYAGSKNKGTVNFNRETIGKFMMSRGYTNSSQYITKLSGNQIELWQRYPSKKIPLEPRTKRARSGRRATFIPKVY